MVFGEINSAISIAEKIQKWWRNKTGSSGKNSNSVASRMVALLESHGVHRNQIPRFIGHGLTLANVKNDARLLEKLTDETLDDVAERFAVQREWLVGADDQIYPHNDFYKKPDEFLHFLNNLQSKNPENDISGLLIKPENPNRRAEALIMLQECIGLIGEKPIYRYYLCNNWPFSYWKARAYLTACIAIAWKKNIYIHGLVLPEKQIDQLASGNMLLGWQGEGFWKLGFNRWDPEDMTLAPEKYLDGLDPEEDNFGIKSALNLWLTLERQGYMDSGLGSESRTLFSEEWLKR